MISFWIYLLIAFILGWNFSVFFKNLAFFEFDSKVEIFDVVSLFVTVFVSIFIAEIIGKSLSDRNSDKNFLFNEIDYILQRTNTLQNNCQIKRVLSLNETIAEISYIRKRFNAIWEYIGLINNDIQKSQKDLRDDGLIRIKEVNSKLTDSNLYTDDVHLKIERGLIYLNNGCRPEIDGSIEKLKMHLLKCRCSINKL